MKAYIPLILILVVVIGGIVFVFAMSGKQPEIYNPITSVGEIIRIELNATNGSSAIIEYRYKGMAFETRIGSYANKANIIGEKYQLEFDENKPENCKVYLDKPVFLENEKTIKTTGVIKKISPTNHKELTGIVFEYKVKENSITRAQSISISLKDILSKGQEYTVEYWYNNPKRAIIYIE
ncbi:MAG TPA: hypothetical protein PK199_01760 [Bacteroidales bacterium]|nr:hypothetical protein [Bacteroidales bacterium]